ncbi:MAG: N-6 DNA methylase [Pseudomonadota bacterium]
MLDVTTKSRINSARDILVGKVPNPISQVQQITFALIYKFMNDMDKQAVELGGERSFFRGNLEQYAWDKLISNKVEANPALALYSKGLEELAIAENIPPLFRTIFKNASIPYRDGVTFKSFIKIIDEFHYSHSEKLGDAFEFLLSVLGSQGDAGQFRTPRHIIDFMVELIDPKKNETVLDPACGTAGFLISAYKHIIKNNSANYNPETDKRAFEMHAGSVTEIGYGDENKQYKGDKLKPDERIELNKNISGYDISPEMVEFSLVNFYLHQCPNPKIFEYDSLTSVDRWNENADVYRSCFKNCLF